MRKKYKTLVSVWKFGAFALPLDKVLSFGKANKTYFICICAHLIVPLRRSSVKILMLGNPQINLVFRSLIRIFAENYLYYGKIYC